MSCWTTSARRSPGSLNPNDLLGLRPDLLYPVMRALLLAEDVQHQVAEVDQHPARFRFAFAVVHPQPRSLDLFDEGVGYGVELTYGADAHDDHEVGESADVVDVEQHHVGRLAVGCDVDGEVGGFVGADDWFRGTGGACHGFSIRRVS